MKPHNTLVPLLATAALLFGGCALSSGQDAPDESADPGTDRGGIPTGKADGQGLPGVCGELTSGASPDGCFCDEACCDYNDCCEDRADSCGGETPETPETPEIEEHPVKGKTYEMYGRSEIGRGKGFVHCQVILEVDEKGWRNLVYARQSVEAFHVDNDLDSLTWEEVTLGPAWNRSNFDEHGLTYYFWMKQSWLGELDPFAKLWGCARPDEPYGWMS